VAYLLLNVFYSLWLRDVVIVDVLVIATGFVLRALAGAQDKVITLDLERRELEVVITVADTGPGIPVENRGRIFSGRYSSRGGGQGLFRSREILRRWRGEIRLVDPESGTGALFTVTLPAAVKDPAAAG